VRVGACSSAAELWMKLTQGLPRCVWVHKCVCARVCACLFIFVSLWRCEGVLGRCSRALCTPRARMWHAPMRSVHTLTRRADVAGGAQGPAARERQLLPAQALDPHVGGAHQGARAGHWAAALPAYPSQQTCYCCCCCCCCCCC